MDFNLFLNKYFHCRADVNTSIHSIFSKNSICTRTSFANDSGASLLSLSHKSMIENVMDIYCRKFGCCEKIRNGIPTRNQHNE